MQLKSFEYTIDGTERSAERALNAAEQFAKQSKLSEKQALHLRLLTEEMIGLMNSVVELEEGVFYMVRSDDADENGKRKYELHLTAKTLPIGEHAKEHLLRTATTGVNESYRGVSGKLRMALDWFCSGLSESGAMPVQMESGYIDTVSEPQWSLEQFRKSVGREKKADDWDELELSVLSRLASDIRVGVRSGKASIVIYLTM